MDVIDHIGPDINLEIDEKRCSAQRIKFKNTGATIVTGSGSAKSPLRGQTIQYLLADEIAFWGSSDDAIGSIIPTIDIGNMVCIQSTPSHRGTLFYNYYMDAKTSTYASKVSLKPLFYTWKDLKEFRETPPPTWMPNDDDINCMAEHSLTLDQTYWRRLMLGSDKPNIEKRIWFARNYPLSDETCWDEAGSNCPFIIEDLNKLITRDPVAEDEELRIYIPPNPAMRYYIGVDTSYGIKKDDNALVVLDEKRNVCATLSSNAIPARKFAHMIKKTGLMYNTAEVTIETNAAGFFVAQILTELEYPYRKINTQTTTMESRNLLLSLLDNFISHSVSINDIQLKQQLGKFSRSTEEMKNIKDDLGMALAWALFTVDEYRPTPLKFYHPSDFVDTRRAFARG